MKITEYRFFIILKGIKKISNGNYQKKTLDLYMKN